jgi:anti-sigma factor RsiW
MNHHLGHRLSALIDGELADAERDRVLVHLARCDSCREDAVALRTLKRRMSALGETAADSTLTRRLIGLAQAGGPFLQGGSAAGPERAGMGSLALARASREFRSAWYVAIGCAAVFLIGVGIAAFMAGGTGQPVPRVTPAVDMYMVQHDITTGVVPVTRPRPTARPSRQQPVQQSATLHAP